MDKAISLTSGNSSQIVGLWLVFLGAAIMQRIGAQADGAVERTNEARCQTLHGGVFNGAKAIGNELGIGQDIAQIMIDFADRQALTLPDGFSGARCLTAAFAYRPKRVQLCRFHHCDHWG